MELNTRIAFLVTIIVELITITFAFITYNTYLNISVYQGKQIKTSDGQIYTEIDEFFRDDVSIPTVKHISRIIAKEIDKDVESDIYEFIKHMVRGNLNYNLDNFLKKERKEEDTENIYDILGKINFKDNFYEITDIDTCSCTPSAVSTKTCAIWKQNGPWGWLDEDTAVNGTYYNRFLSAAGQYRSAWGKMGLDVNNPGGGSSVEKIYKACALHNNEIIPGMLISSIGAECQQHTPINTFIRPKRAVLPAGAPGAGNPFNDGYIGGAGYGGYPKAHRDNDGVGKFLEQGYCIYRGGYTIKGIPSQSQSNDHFKMLNFDGETNEYNIFFSQGENIHN